ncbi:MAG: glucokinase [Spirochaetaceae bacterium]
MRHIRHERQFDTITLSCDVGGTNTSIGAVGRVGRRFELIDQLRLSTRDQTSLESPLRDGIDRFKSKVDYFDYLCVSGAGPVRENRCRLSNVSWEIDGDALSSSLGIPATVINDFTAISYGVPLLDVTDPGQITPIPRSGDEKRSRSKGRRVYAVVGAGTGLGVGYLIGTKKRLEAFPSEGGHTLFGPFDGITREFYDYLTRRYGELLDTELFVSGQGIANLADFYRESGRLTGEAKRALDGVERVDVPARVADLAVEDESARQIMEVFVSMYGKVAANVALTFLPTEGLYLAGGIASKNEGWFTKSDTFTRAFEGVYKNSLVDTLRQTPVYIIKDYAISLYGAAHAAYWILDRG